MRHGTPDTLIQAIRNAFSSYENGHSLLPEVSLEDIILVLVKDFLSQKIGALMVQPEHEKSMVLLWENLGLVTKKENG